MPPPATEDASVTITPPHLPNPSGLEQTGEHITHLALVAIGHIARTRWLALAQRRLRQNRAQMAAYVAGIGQPVVTAERVSISLHGDEANRIEQGRPQIDLRDVLLGSRVPVKERGQSGPGKLRSRAGGFYRAIPMTQGGGAIAAARGTPQLTLVASGGQAVEHHLHQAARAVMAPVHAPAGKPAPALGGHIPQALHAVPHAAHTTDPMARLYRLKPPPTSPGGRRGRSVGVNFRTISTNKPGGWILRPKPGADLMPQLQKILEREVPPYLEKLLAAHGHTQAPDTPTKES